MKLRLRHRIISKDIFYTLLYIPFFEPSYIGHNVRSLHLLFRVATYVAIVCIGFIYISSLGKTKRRLSKPVIFSFLYALILAVSTVINRGQIISSVVEGGSLIALFMLTDMLCRKSMTRFLSIIYPVLYVLVVINFITMILYPNGMYLYVMDGLYYWASNFNWFLGLENSMIIFLLPTIVYTYILFLQKGSRWNRFNVILITTICIYIPIVRWKAATIVCFAVFFVVVILASWRMLPDIFNARNYIIFNIIFFVSLVIVGVQGGIVTYITESILHKSDTLGVRMNIWHVVIDLIKRRPLLGYGYEATRIVTDKMRYDSAHNQYLWIIYRGGILQFSTFAYYLWSVARKLVVAKEYLAVKIVSIGFFVALLMWQTEAITAYPIMVFLVFSYYFADDKNYIESLEKYMIKKKIKFSSTGNF